MKSERLLGKDVSTLNAIVHVLEEAGIDMVFGVPGGNSMKIFDALYDATDSVRTVLVRHESLAGVMAEVYGRLTGKPGVAVGQGLFMLTNALLGVAEAHLGSSPMLVLADLSDGAPFSHHAPYQAGTGDYGTWNAAAAFSGVTKAAVTALTPEQAVQQTQLALKHALAGEPGPVAVFYHSRSLAGTVGPTSVPRLYATPAYLQTCRTIPDAASLEEAARVLSKAKLPVVIAGNGVRMSRAYRGLQAFAETLGAPVVTTAGGKGVFPETHPLSLGLFGTFGLEAANAAVEAADVLVVVGSKLAPSDTAFENPRLVNPAWQTVVQIDVEPRNMGWTFPCDHPLSGDAARVLARLTEELGASGRVSETLKQEREAFIEKARKEHGFFDEPEFSSDETPLLPQRIAAAIGAAMEADAILTCDAGENRLFMTRFFRVKEAGTFLSPAATGGMGYAIPAALAAKLVHPERRAVAVCGDGGVAMSMNGLLTAVEEKIPIVTVVLNNRALGWVKHYQQGRVIASEFPDTRIDAIARAMGCHGVRVEDPGDLAAELKAALSRDVPSVLDVVTSLDVDYRSILSPLAAG